jgi:hypothetical protein
MRSRRRWMRQCHPMWRVSGRPDLRRWRSRGCVRAAGRRILHADHLQRSGLVVRPVRRWMRERRPVWQLSDGTDVRRGRDRRNVRCTGRWGLYPDFVRRSEYRLRSSGRRLRQCHQLRQLHRRHLRRRRDPGAVRPTDERTLHTPDLRGSKYRLRSSGRWLWQRHSMRRLSDGSDMRWWRRPRPVRGWSLPAVYVRGAWLQLRSSGRWLRQPTRLRHVRGASNVRRRRNPGTVRGKRPALAVRASPRAHSASNGTTVTSDTEGTAARSGSSTSAAVPTTTASSRSTSIRFLTAALAVSGVTDRTWATQPVK